MSGGGSRRISGFLDERIPGDAAFLRDFDQYPGSTRRRAAWVRELILAGWRAQNGQAPVLPPPPVVAVRSEPVAAARLETAEAPREEGASVPGLALVCELLGETPAPTATKQAAE